MMVKKKMSSLYGKNAPSVIVDEYLDTDSIYDVSSLYPQYITNRYVMRGGRSGGKTFQVESFLKGVFNGDEHTIVDNIPFSTSPREIYTIEDMNKRNELTELIGRGCEK